MFVRGLDRIKDPCMWGIITVWFCLMANAPYFPGVGEGGFTLTGALVKRAIINQKECLKFTKKNMLHVNNFFITDKNDFKNKLLWPGGNNLMKIYLFLTFCERDLHYCPTKILPYL